MDRSTRVERTLPALFEELAQARTPDYLEAAIERASSRPQRPFWTFPERLLPMDITNRPAWAPAFPWRQLGVLAVLAILIAAMLAAYVGSTTRLPEPFGPAANGVVVFSKNGDILVRDSIDGSTRSLVATAEVEIAESLSPRGTHVLMVRPIGEELHLFAATIDGRDDRRLGGPYLNVDGIAWSPDESSIAISHEVDGKASISIVRTDGGGERTLDLGMPASSPAWRPPDGRQLSFRGQFDGNWGLFIANADGSGVKRVEVDRDLLEAPYEALAPAWSPTGDRIAFHRLVLTPGNGNGNGFRIDVAQIDPDGLLTAQQTYEFDATSDDEHSAQWLPDGEDIVFMRRDGTTEYLSFAHVDAGATSRDTEVNISTQSFGMLRVTIAPDGETVLVHKLDNNSDWSVDVPNGDAVQIDTTGDDMVFIQRRAL